MFQFHVTVNKCKNILYFFHEWYLLFKLWLEFLNLNLIKLQQLSLRLKEVKYQSVAPNSLPNLRVQAAPNGAWRTYFLFAQLTSHKTGSETSLTSKTDKKTLKAIREAGSMVH